MGAANASSCAKRVQQFEAPACRRVIYEWGNARLGSIHPSNSPSRMDSQGEIVCLHLRKCFLG